MMHCTAPLTTERPREDGRTSPQGLKPQLVSGFRVTQALSPVVGDKA